MRKLYSVMAVAALGSLSMMAGGRSTQVRMPEKQNLPMAKAEFKLAKATTPSFQASSIAEMTGDYLWTYDTYLNNGGTERELTVEAGANANELYIKGMCPQVPSAYVKATVDFASGKVTIANNQYICDDSDGPCYFYLKSINASQTDFDPGASTAAATVGTINGANIVFPASDIWAVGDPNNESIGWWALCDTNVLENQSQQGDPNEGWTALPGKGELIDGWMYPGFGIDDPASEPIQVDVQVSEFNNNVYRIVNPYASSLFGTTEFYKAGGYIQFDVTDPTFVEIVPGFFNGIQTSTGKFQNVNVEGYFAAQGYSKAEIIAGIEGYEATTYANRVVNVPQCYFLVAGGGPYTWQNQAGQSLAYLMVGKITLPESNSVNEINTENGVVEYFNLQGVRVVNPEVGQLVIARQGGKATKMIVR